MACCDDETTCPMHKSDSHGSQSAHHVTQTQADSCCAGSQRNDSGTSRITFVLSGTVALVVATVPAVVPPIVPALQDWRARVPPRVAAVPKHLLLSVILV